MKSWIPAFAGKSAPMRACISAVRVRTGGGHSSVAEGNCVAERRGGKQPEANLRSVAKRTRFGGVLRRACSSNGEAWNQPITLPWRPKR
jgi:hypothetical protein